MLKVGLFEIGQENILFCRNVCALFSLKMLQALAVKGLKRVAMSLMPVSAALRSQETVDSGGLGLCISCHNQDDSLWQVVSDVSPVC